MSLANVRTAVRTDTAHDNDTQVTDAQIDVFIDLEYRRVRRDLTWVTPTLYLTTETSFALTSSAFTHAIPSDFDRIYRVERQDGTRWFPIDVASEPDATVPMTLSFREEGTNLIFSPAELVAGTYRLTYHVKPVAGYSTIDVPDGLEDVVIHRTAAQVRIRFNEDPSPHERKAEAAWTEALKNLRRRYGAHPQPGIRRVRGW